MSFADACQKLDMDQASADCGFGDSAVGRMLAGDQPGIDHGEVGWDDRQEEKYDSDDLGDVKHIPCLEEVGQSGKGNNSQADDGTCHALCPGFVIVGKHSVPPFVTLE
jgi:hypothetical protein